MGFRLGKFTFRLRPDPIFLGEGGDDGTGAQGCHGDDAGKGVIAA